VINWKNSVGRFVDLNFPEETDKELSKYNLEMRNALFQNYAASSGNSTPMFRDILSVPSSMIKVQDFLTLEDGTDRLS